MLGYPRKKFYYYISIIIDLWSVVEGVCIVTCYNVIMPLRRSRVIYPILLANPLHSFGRKQLLTLTGTQRGQLVTILIHPATEGLATHTRCRSKLTLIHCLHSSVFFYATKLLKINDIRKFSSNYFYQ